MVFTYCTFSGLLQWEHGKSRTPDATPLWNHYSPTPQTRYHRITTRRRYKRTHTIDTPSASSTFDVAVMAYLESAKKKITPLMEETKLISDDEANELGKKDVDR